MNYLTVDLYKEFQCVGGACLNTCCAGWRVFIDKKTRERMVEKEEKLGVPAREWIIGDKEKPFVKLREDGRCPMLTEDNLCRVVLKLGPEYLSQVCAIYPRENKCYGDTTEGHLFLSCPEVILRLMEKEAVEFDVTRDQKPEVEYPYTRLYRFECAVRAAIVGVLQGMPRISLATRLFTAFTVLEEGIRMYQAGQLDGGMLEREVAYYAQEDVLRGLEAQLRQMVDVNSQRQFLGRILEVVEEYAKSRQERFLKLIQQARQYFSEDAAEAYLSEVQAFQGTCHREYSGFYTNYWVYRIFSDILSIPEYEEAKEKFIYIAVEFALFQAMALASFAKNKKLDREEYIYAISCLSRLAEHTKNFYDGLMEQIRQNNMASAAGMMLLSFL